MMPVIASMDNYNNLCGATLHQPVALMGISGIHGSMLYRCKHIWIDLVLSASVVHRLPAFVCSFISCHLNTWNGSGILRHQFVSGS